MKANPQLMTSALNLHNSVMRKVRWENCGFTVEQEGDSFTMVFYTAVDAAAFCLQVGSMVGWLVGACCVRQPPGGFWVFFSCDS
jgi:hypothetical protein